MSLTRRCFAEAIGTAILVFMGCGAAVVLGAAAGGGHLAVALAFGLALIAAAYAIGSISGCHINPAVSLAMLINKRIKAAEFAFYAIAQIVGAIAGAALLMLIVSLGVIDQTGGLGSNAVGAGGIGGALVVEITLSFIFVLTVLGVTAKGESGRSAGIVIGLTLVLVHIVGIPITGTSVNPARSIGPALFAGGGALSDLWLFIVAPLTGAILAAIVFALFRSGKKSE